MNIKVLKAFTLRNSSTGEMTSFAHGLLYAVESELGSQLITDGLAEEYSGDVVYPTGSITITENGTYTVTPYTSAVVNVGAYIVAYDANGGTGTIDSVAVGAGGSVTLDDGSDLTAPSNKEFAGWATEDTATDPDVESPYTPTEDIVLYAVWKASE